MTSMLLPFDILTQLSHLLQGLEVGPFTQFNAFAKILAREVLPVPRGPQKI